MSRLREVSFCLAILVLGALVPRALGTVGSGGFQGLGQWPGGTGGSAAIALSSDGSTAVGHSSSAASYREAFRWRASDGMTPLGDLPGSIFESSADAVSGNGAVVAGVGNSASGYQAFRWTTASGMV